MFQNLSDKLQDIVKKIKGQNRIGEKELSEIMREVKLALLEADVNYKVVKDFITKVSEKSLGEEVMRSLTPGQQVVKIVKDELVNLLGDGTSNINLSPNPPSIIMLVGLQGSGKTTLAGKLANMLRKKGKKPLLVACDVYRPAAIKQLQVLGTELGIRVYSEENNKDVVSISKNAINQAKIKLNDVVIIDTAGRLHIDDELMNELINIKKNVRPHEILLVIDSMIGQDAVNTAISFNEKVGIDGIAMTKLDGDMRGGAALSVKTVTGKPIKISSIGEKMNDIEQFNPEQMASRILGMGDVLGIIQKAEEVFDEKEAEDLAKRLRKNQFNLDDYLSQLQKIRKMGSFKQILSMLPGIPKELKDADIDEKKFVKIEAIIQSMTKKEREDPNLLNASRRKRIASGSGTQVSDINQFINQFEQTQKMMKQLKSNPKALNNLNLPFKF